jgi:hypothetical protein
LANARVNSALSAGGSPEGLRGLREAIEKNCEGKVLGYDDPIRWTWLIGTIKTANDFLEGALKPTDGGMSLSQKVMTMLGSTILILAETPADLGWLDAQTRRYLEETVLIMRRYTNAYAEETEGLKRIAEHQEEAERLSKEGTLEELRRTLNVLETLIEYRRRWKPRTQ